MFIIGLTGSVGMGKTTVGGMFKHLGIPVFDSDSALHRIMSSHGLALKKVKDLFPGTVKDHKLIGIF